MITLNLTIVCTVAPFRVFVLDVRSLCYRTPGLAAPLGVCIGPSAIIKGPPIVPERQNTVNPISGLICSAFFWLRKIRCIILVQSIVQNFYNMVITFHVTLILEISTITPIGFQICVVLLGVYSCTPRLAILIGECVGPGASVVLLATIPKWEDTGISSSALLCPAFGHNCRMTKKYCRS